MIMGRFTGRTAVVTGGTSGIGRAIAGALGQEGARVFVAGRDVERGAAAAREVDSRGGEGVFHRTDVGIDSEVQQLAAAAAAGGPIDFWFSNAGIEGPIGPISTWTDDALRQILEINIKGVLSGLRHASENMAAGGIIINTASFVGTALPVPIAVPYAATKAAVVAAGRSAAPLLADDGIRVFTLCPWVIDTPMVTRLAGDDPQDRAGFAAGFAPSGRLTPVDDVAQVALDLLDGTLAARSGDALLVDAGPTTTPLD
jgi:NAD(P)-dependent dehydrogenase (short-subunit alcohol dehydrogenase family)